MDLSRRELNARHDEMLHKEDILERIFGGIAPSHPPKIELKLQGECLACGLECTHDVTLCLEGDSRESELTARILMGRFLRRATRLVCDDCIRAMVLPPESH
jgi:hypothetical protein